MTDAMPFEEQIRKILAARSFQRMGTADENFAPSAVLLLLLQTEKGAHVLFTKRSDEVPHHKGEISFPGGRREPGDPARDPRPSSGGSEGTRRPPGAVDSGGHHDPPPAAPLTR